MARTKLSSPPFIVTKHYDTKHYSSWIVIMENSYKPNHSRVYITGLCQSTKFMSFHEIFSRLKKFKQPQWNFNEACIHVPIIILLDKKKPRAFLHLPRWSSNDFIEIITFNRLNVIKHTWRLVELQPCRGFTLKSFEHVGMICLQTIDILLLHAMCHNPTYNVDVIWSNKVSVLPHV